MPSYWPTVASGLTAALASAFLIRALPERLAASGMVRSNFRGHMIPTACGLAIIGGAGLGLAVLGASTATFSGSVLAMLTALIGFGALGLADDRWGGPGAKGLRGHVRRLILERRFTSGLGKAAGGIVLGLLIAGPLLGASEWAIVLKGAVIALSANLVNLLDLRPGRATAASLALLAAAIAALGGRATTLEQSCVLCIALAAAATYRRDALGALMLGDTGSNALGACVGVSALLAAQTEAAQYVLLAGLVGVHVVAERWSISAIIEAHPLLRALDRLTGVR